MGIVFKNIKQRRNKNKSKGRHKKNKNKKYSIIKLSQKIKKQVHQIRLLVGMTEADFELLYLSVIEMFVLVHEPLCDDFFTVVINALKRRRGYLLPAGADSEVSFREYEAWTYAVFSAVVLKMLLIHGVDHSPDELKSILPPQGLLWLERHAVLIQEWNRYLMNDQDTIFAELIGFIPKTDLGRKFLIKSGDCYDNINNNT